jgi:hypothetical protein
MEEWLVTSEEKSCPSQEHKLVDNLSNIGAFCLNQTYMIMGVEHYPQSGSVSQPLLNAGASEMVLSTGT